MSARNLDPGERTPVSSRAISEDQLQQHLYELAILGFTIVPEMIFPSESQKLRDSLSDVLAIERVEYAQNPYWTDGLVNNLAIYGDRFHWLLDHGIMHQIFGAILGAQCVLYTYSSTLLEPESVAEVHEIHVDTPRFSGSYTTGLSMVLALSDFSLENGATWILPGSFNSPEQPSPEVFERFAMRLIMSEGDAAFFHPRTFHRAGINSSSETRYGISIYAVRSFMKQRYDYPRAIPEAEVVQMSSRTKRFFGFNVRVPIRPEEFYVAPDERLYLPGQG